MDARGRSSGWARWAIGLALVCAVPVASCSTSQTLACPLPASTGCPSLDGVTTFCSWGEWGCAPQTACSGYLLVVDQTAGARFTYYYSAATGQFVATVEEAFGGGNATCVAGPSLFQVPTGCEPDTLADCAPPPRDGGIGPGDAATDAPFIAPTPSGNPSAQPFSAAPRPNPP